MSSFTCTESNTAPILDIVWASLLGIGIANATADPELRDQRGQVIATNLSWAILSGFASASGFRKSKECRHAKQLLAERQQSLIAAATPTPTDSSVTQAGAAREVGRSAESTSPSKNRFHLAMGTGVNTYPQSTNAYVDAMKPLPNYAALPYAAEFAYYRAVASQRTYVGVIMGAFGEYVTALVDTSTLGTFRRTAAFSVVAGHLGLSVLHSLSHSGNRGFYIRGDVGPALVLWDSPQFRYVTTTRVTCGVTCVEEVISSRLSGIASETFRHRASGNGFGALGSIGYSIPLDRGRALSISLDYSYRSISDNIRYAPNDHNVKFGGGKFTSVVGKAGVFW